MDRDGQMDREVKRQRDRETIRQKGRFVTNFKREK